jgi:hypothetical protein
LIGGLGNCRVDARDGLLLRHQQPGQVFGKMAALGGIGKAGPTLFDGVLNESRKLNTGGYCRTSPGDFPALTPSAYRKCADVARSPRILQKLSYT